MIQHTLWKVSNGWLLVPSGNGKVLDSAEAPLCAVFKTLDEFAKWKPVRKRNRKPKGKEPVNADNK